MKARTPAAQTQAADEVSHSPPRPPDVPDFALTLKKLRAQAGLSQEELAHRARVSVQAVSALERGYRRVPYHETVGRLADALELSGEVRRELEAIAAQARAARLRASRLIPASHNLPTQLTSFLGRDDVLSDVVSLLRTHRLVTLVGTGGVGKTRTAIEVGRGLVDDLRPVWFVDFGSLNDPSLVRGEIAGVLGIKESRQPLLELLVASLSHKSTLLVLDSCEHVIAEVVDVLRAVLPSCPNVTVLATSREPLRIGGENVYRIPPLAVPGEATSATEALTYGSVALFVERAVAADARFALTDENAAPVAEICRRLDGLPLAIELAAARITVLSPRQLSQRLHRAFEVLSGSQRPLPRQQTMRGVIDWSYGLLSAQARLLFERVSVFAGGFTLDAAVGICGGEGIDVDDVFDVLASLVDKSLVIADFRQGDARYSLLELTRQYAFGRLEERGQLAAFARRHAETFAAIAERMEREWYAPSEAAWIHETECELDNYRAALEWSLGGRHDVLTGQRLVAALAQVWYSLSATEGRRWVVAALEAIDSGTPATVVARLHIAEAKLFGALGEYKASFDAAQRSLFVLRDIDDPLQRARAQQTAGSALGALGKTAEAERLLSDATQIAQSLGNARLTAMALTDLGTARSRSGDLAAARRYYAHALAMYSGLGLQRPAASVAGHLAELEFASGDVEAAYGMAVEALDGHTAAHNNRSAAVDLCNMAAYLIALGSLEEARTHATQALAIARDVQATVLTMFVLQHLAAVLALRVADRQPRPHDDQFRAARLLGFVDQRLAALEARREHTERQEYDRVRLALNEALGEARLQRLIEEGSRWSEERAISEALEA